MNINICCKARCHYNFQNISTEFVLTASVFFSNFHDYSFSLFPDTGYTPSVIIHAASNLITFLLRTDA